MELAYVYHWSPAAVDALTLEDIEWWRLHTERLFEAIQRERERGR